jgi:hypothetical protein
MYRGVIAAPGIITPHQNGFTLQRSLSKEELRYYLLYWDNIVIPGNNLVYVGLPEETELIGCGAIYRPIVNFQGPYGGDKLTNAILSCQSIVAQELMQDKNVDWVIHQIGDSVILPRNSAPKQHTIRVALSNILPVPDEHVRIADILEFKHKRRDELTQLHNQLDYLYFEVLNSLDQSLATKKVISSLRSAINDLNKVSTEKFKKTKKYNFSAELNINGKDIISGVSRGALIGFLANPFIIPITSILGGLVTLIKISTKLSYTFEPAKDNSKLAYISIASKENILGSPIKTNK